MKIDDISEEGIYLLPETSLEAMFFREAMSRKDVTIEEKEHGMIGLAYLFKFQDKGEMKKLPLFEEEVDWQNKYKETMKIIHDKLDGEILNEVVNELDRLWNPPKDEVTKEDEIWLSSAFQDEEANLSEEAIKECRKIALEKIESEHARRMEEITGVEESEAIEKVKETIYQEASNGRFSSDSIYKCAEGDTIFYEHTHRLIGLSRIIYEYLEKNGFVVHFKNHWIGASWWHGLERRKKG